MWRLTLAVLILLNGCIADSLERPEVVYSPDGYAVGKLKDQGGYVGGWLTEAEVLGWLDDRVDEWARQRAPSNPEGLKAAVRADVGFNLLAARRIETRYSPTGYAVGLYYPNSKTVIACIWATQGAWELPELAPLHTANQNPADGLWYFGYLPPEGGLQVIGHELDHYIGIDHD